MISAIVLTPDRSFGRDTAHAREIVARSLIWLVSAVVEGVVRDVTLATSAGLGLADLADQSGCDLVEGEAQAQRLVAAAASTSRQARLIVIEAGYYPESGLIDELAALVRREPVETFAALRAAPTTALQRLLPRRAPIVGIFCPTESARLTTGFAALARQARGGLSLQASAKPIV